MIALSYSEPELVIALNRKIIFVNPYDLQIFKEIELPEDLRRFGLKTLQNAAESEKADNSKESSQSAKDPKHVQEAPRVLQVKLSPNRQLCAVTTAGQKAVLVYQCRPENAKLVSARPLARASSALVFKNDSNALLVTDKSGDCYEYDCANFDEPRLLFGHLSIVYDVIWTHNTKYIITCDRDDKIRITNYPETYDIHGYCLGHKEFVSGLYSLDDESIVSVSGDKTLRVWNFENGDDVLKVELPAPALRLILRSIGTNKYQAAVLLFQPDECIGIYELCKDDAGKWTASKHELLKFSEIIVCNLCFVGEKLYVAGTVDGRTTLKAANLAGDVSEVPENWLQMIEEQFKGEVCKPDDVSAWFKKRYDNISEYLERKKRRIQEKQK